MRYPNCLIKKDRLTFSENYILSWHYMYARHPKSFWDEESGYPKYEKISSQQSFNWSAFSIPIWVRFNDKKDYKKSNGVAGYFVQTIKNAHLIDPIIPPNSYGLRHFPLEYNYSHCELYPDQIEKRFKRAFRMALKHKCKVIINPYSSSEKSNLIIDYLMMYYHKIFVYLSSIFGR